MKVIANCQGMKLEIPCGAGKQHMRWLALVVATRMQREKYPHAFCVPQGVRSQDGQQLFRPRQVISDTLKDGAEVIIELRQGASIPEEDEDAKEWLEEAYGPNSNLMECKFRWKGDTRNSSEGFPKMVRGDYLVAPRWQGVYPQKDYGGRFEAAVEIVETGDVDNPYDWVASRKG